MKFELAYPSDVILSETPIWDDRINKLYWTDLVGGYVHRFDPDTGSDEYWDTGKPIGGAVPTNDPNIVLVAIESGMHLLNLATGELEFLVNPDTRPDYKYNDTRCDAVGRIFTSSVTVHYGSDKHTPDMLGGFFMVDTDGKTVCLVEGIKQYNAIVWNKANTKMFVVETDLYKLLCFPYSLESGAGTEFYEALDLSPYGMPDGMSIDEEDNLYICHWSGKITVWNSDLKLKEIFDTPVEYNACGGFGGTDLYDYYVATSKYQYDAAMLMKNPGAGGIFVGRNAIKGRKDNYYIIR